MPDRTGQTSKSAANIGRKWYVFALAALTVFVVGLTIWRSPIRGYVASCSVVVEFAPVRDSSSKQTSNAFNWREEIASDDKVRTAILTTSSSRESSDEADLGSEVRRIQNAVQVTSETGNDANQSRIQITVVGQTSQEAVQLADQLALQFVAMHHQAAQDKTWQAAIEETSADFDRARQAETAAWNQFATTVTQQFDQLIQQVDSVTDVETAREPTKNSQWVRLNDRINALIDERAELLKQQRTESHPKVLDIAVQIKQLREQLERTPEFEVVESDQPAPQSTTLKRLAARITSLSATFNDLQAKLVDARQTRESIEATSNEPGASEASQTILVARIDESAKLVSRLGSAPPLGRIALLGFVGLIAGGVLSWATGLKKAGTLMTIENVEQLVPVPIVGVISSAESANTQLRHAEAYRWSRIATVACEIVLALFLLGLLLVALWDSPITSSFLSDPYGTVSESLSRFWNP